MRDLNKRKKYTKEELINELKKNNKKRKNTKCLREDCNEYIEFSSDSFCSAACKLIVKDKINKANQNLIKEDLYEQDKKELREIRKTLRGFR